MFGIKYEIVKDATMLIAGCLLAAGFAGFSLLKVYEEFRKGVEQNSRLRIWSAFFGLAFLVILFATIIVRTSK